MRSPVPPFRWPSTPGCPAAIWAQCPRSCAASTWTARPCRATPPRTGASLRRTAHCWPTCLSGSTVPRASQAWPRGAELPFAGATSSRARSGRPRTTTTTPPAVALAPPAQPWRCAKRRRPHPWELGSTAAAPPPFYAGATAAFRRLTLLKQRRSVTATFPSALSATWRCCSLALTTRGARCQSPLVARVGSSVASCRCTCQPRASVQVAAAVRPTGSPRSDPWIGCRTSTPCHPQRPQGLTCGQASGTLPRAAQW
mmetsp:Transcript_56237/g.180540  ORF Transcript_56237/g.180540 Transcript_56237/m.180540 type:complete len:256 (+) Transcript_56237:1170-1937(+)